MALVEHWPLFGLRVRTPLVELRYPDDELGGRLGALVAQGIHDPAWMPFGVPFTDAPVADQPRNTLVYLWTMRSQLGPEAWHLPLVSLLDGEPVGAGSLGAEHFSRRRTFETGSWVTRRLQGRGLGFEFRQACLHLGFAGLDAAMATTAAWHDNAASLAVTRKLPYERDGEDVVLRREQADRMLRFRMTRQRWEAVRRDDITIEGLEPCLPLLIGDP